MELWIRSQDKKHLIKVNRLSFERNIDDEPTIYGYENYDNYEWLGKYKTKERALEVLDEIQEAQLGNFHYRCSSDVKVSSKEDTIVYEMPEE